MKKVNRRQFLRTAGAGSAVVAAAAVLPMAGLLTWNARDVLKFRAVVGLPRPPLPSYMSYVIEGRVDLASRTGQLSKTVYAGAPEAMSTIAIPGTERTLTVGSVARHDGLVTLRGAIDDRSMLLPGEAPNFEILLDRANGIARGDFFGTGVVMRLEQR